MRKRPKKRKGTRQGTTNRCSTNYPKAQEATRGYLRLREQSTPHPTHHASACGPGQAARASSASASSPGCRACLLWDRQQHARPCIRVHQRDLAAGQPLRIQEPLSTPRLAVRCDALPHRRQSNSRGTGLGGGHGVSGWRERLGGGQEQPAAHARQPQSRRASAIAGHTHTR